MRVRVVAALVVLFLGFAGVVAAFAYVLGATLLGSVMIGVLAAWSLWATLAIIDGRHCD